MPDDGAVSAGKATGVAAGTDEDGFDFAPLMAEGELLIWQGRPRPLWRELWRGNIKGAFLVNVLKIFLIAGVGSFFAVQGHKSEDGVMLIVGLLLLSGGLIGGAWALKESIRTRDRLRYAVTSRQLLVGMAGWNDRFVRLPLYMVKDLTLLEEADGSGTILFHREDKDVLRSARTQSETELQNGILTWNDLKERIPHFALIDDVREVHDLIERQLVRIQEYWKRADAME